MRIFLTRFICFSDFYQRLAACGLVDWLCKASPTGRAEARPTNIFNGIFGFVFLFFLVLCTSAQAAPPGEYEVKAAFIHNIAKFVDWPPRSAGSLKLCVIGQDPFGSALDALDAKPIGDTVWEVVRRNTNLRGCAVLFIPASENNNLKPILTSVQGSAVLTVGDTAGYAEQGVMVNFYLEQNKVRLEINNAAAGRAGFKISSQLLKLARIVAESGEIK
jgi:hypothetical protein